MRLQDQSRFLIVLSCMILAAAVESHCVMASKQDSSHGSCAQGVQKKQNCNRARTMSDLFHVVLNPLPLAKLCVCVCAGMITTGGLQRVCQI